MAQRTKYCHNGGMTFVASYREDAAGQLGSMIGTFGRSSAPQEVAVLQA